jgi:uncharacterized protein YifN (PemK superfamily)
MPSKPEPGMVLSYSYLWNREHIKGETEGRKDRPAVVVLVINRTPGDVAYVLPTSTSNPKDGDPWTIEIPRSIKNRLKLDERRSWINVDRVQHLRLDGISSASDQAHSGHTEARAGDMPVRLPAERVS